jgi:arylsulfatase A-like enzyme
MTGLHTGHAFIRGNANVNLRPQDVTVAEVLKSAGYTTALIGKWGLGEENTIGVPNQKGFDYFFGYLNQTHAHNSYPTFLYRNQQRIPLRNVVPHEGKVGQGVASTKLDFSNDLFTDEILSFLDRSKDKPFFLYAAYTIPHANNEAKGIDVPDQGIYKDKDWPEPQKNHAALITRLDTYVGQILQKLKDLGLDDNTLVFFTSDNGPHKEGGNKPEWSHSSGPFRGIKRDMYDGGIHVPMIARWPGKIAPNTTTDQVLAFWDFLPTAADLAQTQPPARLDGLSVLPTLLDKPQKKQHEFLYWEFHEGGFKQAVRMGKWKAVRLAPNKPLELYDLSSDLSESHNIAKDHPRIVRQIEAYLATARTDSKEFPIRIPQTKPART